jgi:type IV pilus assembly protein PilC
MKNNTTPKRPRPEKKKKFLFSFLIGKEKNFLVENLTMLLSSGMNISAALETVQVESRSSILKKMLAYMQSEVENGSTLWQAMSLIGIFNPATIALIKAGEESGRLSENLKIVAQQDEKNRNFRSKLRSALIYPMFVMVLAAIIAIGIAWFILPNLTRIFVQMDIPLPFITRVLIDFGAFLEKSGAIFVPVFVVGFITFIYMLFGNPKTKFIGQSMIFAVPGFKKLIQEGEIARFGYLLGTLLNAGLPIEEALRSVAGAADFFRYRKLYSFLKTNTEEGNSFQKSLNSYPHSRQLIPYTIQQMISAGERSGNLPNTLIKIGDIYEEKVEITTKNLTVILEPVLLVIVWLGVVGVALAIVLPIYSLIGGINK